MDGVVVGGLDGSASYLEGRVGVGGPVVGRLLLDEVHALDGHLLTEELLEVDVLLPQRLDLPLEVLLLVLGGVGVELALLGAVVAQGPAGLAPSHYKDVIIHEVIEEALQENMFVVFRRATISSSVSTFIWCFSMYLSCRVTSACFLRLWNSPGFRVAAIYVRVTSEEIIYVEQPGPVVLQGLIVPRRVREVGLKAVIGEEVEQVRDTHALDVRAPRLDDILVLDHLKEMLTDGRSFLSTYLFAALPDSLEPVHVCELDVGEVVLLLYQ